MLKNIFQRFETVLNRDVSHSSTGIGLSLVREMVELLHGTIDVTSIENEGSEFTVILPVSHSLFYSDSKVEYSLADGESHFTDSAVNEASNTDHERITILIVEDNSELRIFMKNILSNDYHVILAKDGKEGFDKTHKILPDLIISDVMVPVMDGMDMVKKIKEDADICHIPIILLTAKTTLDDRIKGLEFGIDDYIPKPFNSKYLIARIQTLIKQRVELKEYYLGLFSGSQNQTINNLNLPEPDIINKNDEFIKRLMELIDENIGSADIKIEDFAKELSVSRTVFYKKIKSIVGLSPIDFIMEMRIKRAIQYLESSDYTIDEIAYKTGFNMAP